LKKKNIRKQCQDQYLKETLKKAMDKINKQINATNNEMENLRKICDNHEEKNKILKEDIKERKEMLTKLKDNIGSLDDSDLLNQSSFSALNEELSKAKEERMKVESVLDEYEENYQHLKSETDKMKQEITDFRKEQDKLMGVESTHKDLLPKVHDIQRFTAEQKEMQKNLSKNKELLKQLETTNNKQNKKLEKYEDEYAYYKEENKRLSSTKDLMQLHVSETEKDKTRPELQVTSTLDSDDAYIEEPDEDIHDLEKLKKILIQERRKKSEVDNKISRMERKVGKLEK